MVGMDHGPNKPDESEDASLVARNTKIGTTLFVIYSACYSVFVLVNTFMPDWMDVTPLAGVNLAVLSGFSLIIAAFLMALLYGWLCRAQANTESTK